MIQFQKIQIDEYIQDFLHEGATSPISPTIDIGMLCNAEEEAPYELDSQPLDKGVSSGSGADCPTPLQGETPQTKSA